MSDVPAFDFKETLQHLTQRPGVYRMVDEAGRVLYVGKAKNLKKRVSSYFGAKAHHPRIQNLMNLVARVEITITATEGEALLLEWNLIREHKPRFNVLLRDDKSYPYIYVSTRDAFPRFAFHRGARKLPGRFFGPYPNAGAVRPTLVQIQKLFRVRQCEDSFFANRSRPCLQHQIKRCSAPCVDLISAEDYRRDVEDTILFLEGRNEVVLDSLRKRMEQAAADREYEDAARYRDQVAAIRGIQSRQTVSGQHNNEVDAVAVYEQGGIYGITCIFVRGGRVLGSRNLFPRTVPGTSETEVISAFLTQHYLVQAAPPEVLVSQPPEDVEWLSAALAQHAGQPVAIRDKVRGERRGWLEMALANAREAVAMRLAGNASQRERLEQLAEALDLAEPPERIECFDISHTSGAETVASCVVFGPDGAIKSDYRRFNIRDVQAGDDYGAIAQAVQRRYARLRSEEAVLPDLVLIDGGLGQLGRARAELLELQLTELPVAAVAKGPARRPGQEVIFMPQRELGIRLPPDSPALHLIQQIRDEAHRFAITGHRQRRSKARHESALESIPGLGPKRRRELLRHFGGLQGVRAAAVEDLCRVPGISQVLACRIHDHLQGSGT